MHQVGLFAEDEALLWQCCHGDCLPSAASRSLITHIPEYLDFVKEKYPHSADKMKLIITLHYSIKSSKILLTVFCVDSIDKTIFFEY